MSKPCFNCDCCGLCCRNIGGIPQLRQYDLGDGVCCHLTDANLCDIYESRPEVCNVERMYSRFADDMTRAEYFSMMEKACAILKFNSDVSDDSIRHDSLKALLPSIPVSSLSKLAFDVGVELP